MCGEELKFLALNVVAKTRRKRCDGLMNGEENEDEDEDARRDKKR